MVETIHTVPQGDADKAKGQFTGPYSYDIVLVQVGVQLGADTRSGHPALAGKPLDIILI